MLNADVRSRLATVYRMTSVIKVFPELELG